MLSARRLLRSEARYYRRTNGIHPRLPGLCSGRSRSPDQRSGSTSGGVKMTKFMRSCLFASAAVFVPLALGAGAQAQQANMTFFVTSVGSGNGANLGGI